MKNKISKWVQDFVLKKDWEFCYERRMSFHMMYLFYFGIVDEFKNIFGVGMEGSVFRSVNGVVGQYYSKSGIAAIQKEIYKKLNSDKFFPNKIRTLIENRFTRYSSYSKKLGTSYKNYTNKELFSKIKRHQKEEELISAPSWIMFTFFEEVLTRVLEERLGKGVLCILSQQTVLTPLEVYKSELVKRGVDFANKKYQFMGMFDFFFDVKDRSFHEQNMANIKREGFDIQKIKEKHKKIKKEISIIVRAHPEEKGLINLFLTYSNLKEWKNFWREQLAYKYKFLMMEVASRFSLTNEDISVYSWTELERLLKEGFLLSVDEVIARKSNSLFVFQKDDSCIVTDLSLLNKFDERFRSKQTLDVIKGVTAFPGIIRGEVKIIASASDSAKFKEGDILVSSTTRPDYLTFMKMSAGFITNEGGMLSHAAILARELKKPCIIGTKIATKVLKDGDLVEVDANTGLVTILKKYK